MQSGTDRDGGALISEIRNCVLCQLFYHITKTNYLMKQFTAWNIVFAIGFLTVCCTNKKEAAPKKQNATKDCKSEIKVRPYDTVITSEYYHDELSRSFDIKVRVNRFRTIKPLHDSCVAKFTILDKTKRVTDTFSVMSHFNFGLFEDKDHVRSYATQFNKNKKVLDNDYGDIVVADFNFDNKDDLAIVNNTGNNAGSFYNFYLQESQAKFALNRFLTDSVLYFPNEIKNKTLTTFVNAGACHMGKHIYVLDALSGRWREKSHTLIDVCNNKVIKKTIHKK
jgi:hypothetical protein